MDTAEESAVGEYDGNIIHIVFKYQRRKYDAMISFAEISGYSEKEPYDRTAVELVLKQHDTGCPYMGIAVLSPNDLDKLNYSMAIKVAMQRALDSMMIGEFRHEKFNQYWQFDYEERNSVVKGMMDAFRKELFYVITDPETVNRVERIRDLAKQNAAKKEKQKNENRKKENRVTAAQRVAKLVAHLIKKEIGVSEDSVPDSKEESSADPT